MRRGEKMRKSETFRYYSPEFEADLYNPVMLRYSPWAGHRAFAYDYVMNERPSCIVELGSHYGSSAFAFLQAMKDGGIDGSFYAVDTWEGDSLTKNDYREDIYGQYKEIQDRCFSGADPADAGPLEKDLCCRTSSGKGAHMLRMTFDEAAPLFADASIDLLHIDGSHRYEDVKHDFLTWKDKVKKDGVIFFHDIADEEKFGEVLGSHVFWEELVSEYPLTMEFPFSFGLGVLCFDPEKYRRLKEEVSVDHYQMLANHADNGHRDVIRENFFKIRDLTEYRDALIKQVDALHTEIARFEETVRGKEAYITELSQDVGTLNEALAAKDKYIGELRGDLEKYAEAVSGKDLYIASIEDQVRGLRESLDDCQKDAAVREEYIRSLLAGIEGFRADADKKEKYIEELREGIAGYQKDAGLKDAYVEELLEGLRKYKEDAEKKDRYISELLEGLQRYKEDADAKNAYIAELQTGLQKYGEDTDAKDRYIAELISTIEDYGKNTAGKDAYIAELLDRCGSASKTVEEAVLAKDEAVKKVLKYREELSKSLFGRQLLKRMEKSDE